MIWAGVAAAYLLVGFAISSAMVWGGVGIVDDRDAETDTVVFALNLLLWPCALVILAATRVFGAGRQAVDRYVQWLASHSGGRVR